MDVHIGHGVNRTSMVEMMMESRKACHASQKRDFKKCILFLI